MAEPKADNPVKDACRALNIKEREVFASRVYDDGRVVIVTTAGRKLEWRKLEKAASQKGEESK